MAKYKLELKPVRIHGVAALSEEKLFFFNVMLNALAQVISAIDGVENATVSPEYFLEIEGSDGIEETLNKFHDQAIISRIE